MVREAERRKRKYEKNVSGDQVGRAIKAQKDIMLDQEKTYFPQITLIEQKTKALCEAQGIPTIQIAQYLNFAREMYSKAKRFSQATLAAEAQYLLNKWQSRGLLGPKLVEIAKLFGVTPTAAAPPPLLTLIPTFFIGRYYTSTLKAESGSVLSAFMPADRINALPFVATRNLRIDRIGIYIRASNPVPLEMRLGIYKDNGNYYPNKLLLDAGVVITDPTGPKELVIDQLLGLGLYWFVEIHQDIDLRYDAARYWLYGIGGTAVGDWIYGSWRVDYPYGPLPDPFPAGGIAEPRLQPLIHVRIAEVL